MALGLDQMRHIPIVKKPGRGILSFGIKERESPSTFQHIPGPRGEKQAWDVLFSLLVAIELQSVLTRFLKIFSLLILLINAGNPLPVVSSECHKHLGFQEIFHWREWKILLPDGIIYQDGIF